MYVLFIQSLNNLIYCNSIWGFCIKSALQPLKVIKKKIIRGIARSCPYAHTLKFFKSYTVFVLDNTYSYKTAIFVNKCLNGSALIDWFNQRISSHSTRMEVTVPLSVPRVHKNHSEQCISYRGSVTWNKFHLDIRQQTYNCSKMSSKRLLLRNHNTNN